MIRDTQILHKIKHIKSLFDARTYSSFLAVVESIISLREWREADIALFSGKTLRQVEYFFARSRFCIGELEAFRLRFVRGRPNYSDRKGDFAVLDGSAITKDRNSSFSGLAEMLYSNRDKTTVNGFHLFGAAVMTSSGLKYVLDSMLYFKARFMSQTQAWQEFARKVCAKTQAWIFILDSGFKGAHFCSFIANELHRHFLVRIGVDQVVLIERTTKLLASGKRRR